MKHLKWNILKKHIGLVLLIIIVILYDVFYGGLFLSVLLLYGLFIKFLLSDLLSINLSKALSKLVWLAFFLSVFFVYYSNHYFPKGSRVYTGDIVCQYDDRGPCRERYIEDTRNLDIPEWGKFFKSSKGELTVFGLLFAGIVVINKKKINDYDEIDSW